MPTLARKIIVWTGAVILIATAAFHSTGFSAATAAASTLKQGSLLSTALPALWLFPTAHWVFISLISMAASFSNSNFVRVLFGASALVLAFDAGMMLVFIGPFVGEALLAASAILFAWAGLLKPRPKL